MKLLLWSILPAYGHLLLLYLGLGQDLEWAKNLILFFSGLRALFGVALIYKHTEGQERDWTAAARVEVAAICICAVFLAASGWFWCSAAHVLNALGVAVQFKLPRRES